MLFSTLKLLRSCSCESAVKLLSPSSHVAVITLSHSTLHPQRVHRAKVVSSMQRTWSGREASQVTSSCSAYGLCPSLSWWWQLEAVIVVTFRKPFSYSNLKVTLRSLSLRHGSLSTPKLCGYTWFDSETPILSALLIDTIAMSNNRTTHYSLLVYKIHM